MQAAIETADALRIVGLDRTDWRVAVDKAGYRAPPLASGNARFWPDDDLLALAWYTTLTRAGGLTRRVAAKYAAGLLAALQDQPAVAVFAVYATNFEDELEEAEFHFLPVGATPPAGGEHVFTIPAAKWRADLRARVKAYFRHQETRRG